MIKFLDLQNSLKDNDFAAFCIYGNDPWVRRKALARICQWADVTDDMGVDYLDNPTADDIAFACLTPSMFCAKKVVVCQNLPTAEGKGNQIKQKLAKIIEQYDGSFCLVVETESKPLDVAGMEAIDCNKLSSSSVSGWIVAYAKRQGVVVERMCADQIAAYCLCDMARVEMEIQKLIDYGEVTPQSIEQLVHKDAEYVVFDLSKVIANKNATRALELYRGLIASGESHFGLFGLLYNFYRRVYYIKISQYTPEELASMLGVKAGAINFTREFAQKYKPMQLKRALDCFAVADAKLKTFVDDDEVMTTLILQLVSL